MGPESLMIIRLPSGDVKQAVGYMSLEFRGEVLAGDIHFQVVITFWYLEP